MHTARKQGAFLCLAAALLALTTPALFALHTTRAHPACARPGCAHERAVHGSHDCLTCLALLQCVSGAPAVLAQEAPAVSAASAFLACAADAPVPHGTPFSPFLSRAPPPAGSILS